jgi:hypothetical protein
MLPPNTPPFLTTAEVAAMFRVSGAAIRWQRDHGKNPGALGVRVGKKIIFASHEIDAYLEGQRTAAAMRRAERMAS